jgi:putative ABC transport system permease protein
VTLRLVWENISYRPLRTLLSILLIAGPVTLILVLIGISTGLIEDSANRQRGVNADIVFRSPSSSVVSFSGGTMPASLVPFLAKEPHVAEATGVLNQPIGSSIDSVAGIDSASFNRLSGGFVFLQGHGLEKPDDILVDQHYADQSHVKAGDTINILHRDWHVAGVVEPGKLSHLFVDLSVLQDMIGATGKVSQVWLKLDNSALTNNVVADLKKKFDGYQIYSMPELESLISVNSVPALKTFLNVVLGVGVCFGIVVVSLSMYMAVLQRTREIGILKSLGASNGFVMTLILAEAFAMGLGGTFLGIAFSYGTRWILHVFVPASLPQSIVVGWWWRAGLVAMGSALIGAIFPGTLAARQDPIEALAYE